jgi:hypothetical protein
LEFESAVAEALAGNIGANLMAVPPLSVVLGFEMEDCSVP